MVPLGITWSHLVSLGLTSSHLVSHYVTWTHLVSLGLTWTHLDSLLLLFAGVLTGGKTNGTGGNRWKDKRDRGEQTYSTRTIEVHQDTPEHTGTHLQHTGTHPASPRMPHELTEALKTQNGVKVKHHNQGHARARARGALFTVANPSDGNIIASRAHAHTASHRTRETKRFPGCLTPQPPIYVTPP